MQIDSIDLIRKLPAMIQRCGNILGSGSHNYCPNCGARMESDEE